MRDDLQYAARRVFAEFIAAFEHCQGQRGWGIRITAERATAMGLTPSLLRGALDLLQSEDLIEFIGTNRTVTDLGYRACMHRELIDEILGSPAASRGLALHISAQQVIIGDNNTMQVNSAEVIGRLIEHLNADAQLPEPRKKLWLEILSEVSGHIAAEGLKVVIDKAMGK